MRIEQAIYGEVHGGHALRAASGDKQFALGMASKLDLPDTAPPAVTWSPYASGFSHGDHYVLARTFADLSASRSGMVRAHALIMPLVEITQCRNLEPLFAKLITSLDESLVPTGFDLGKDVGDPIEASDLIRAANAFATRGSGPVVRLGMEGFEALVASLWAHLWPEARRHFVFRLSFGPTDVQDNPTLALVCSPPALAGRWSHFRVLNNADGQDLGSKSARLLAGKPESGPLLEFARAIGADLQHLTELPLVERAHELLSRDAGLDDVLAAIRLIEILSADPSVGSKPKRAITSRLSAAVVSATPGQILAMRNLSLSAFPAAPDLWLEIERWMVTRQFDAADDASMTSMIDSARSDAASVMTWRVALSHGIAAAARAATAGLPPAIWRWASAKPNLCTAILELLPSEPDIEMRVASATPEKLPLSVANPLLPLLLTRKWLAAHGAVLSAIDGPMDAVRRQIAVDGNVADASGIRFALRSARPEQILECAIQLGDARLFELAVDAIDQDPSVFSGALCTEIGEQRLWDAALRRRAELWRAPRDPRATRNTVLKGLIDGGAVYSPLIATLAHTVLADLCDFPEREQIWSRLGTDITPAYLQATATGWLKRAAAANIPFTPDKALMEAVTEGTNLDATLLNTSTDTMAALRIIEILDGFDEQRVLTWCRGLLARGGELSTTSMEMLGHLALARSWHHVVDEMVARYRGHRSDLKPALRICASMLGLVTRWTLDLAAPTVDEKWDEFAAVAAELYPTGPEQDELWSRAGGRNSDLPKNGTGGSIWITVLRQMRNGRGPSPARLLYEMQRDYSNDRLRFLAKDRDLAG